MFSEKAFELIKELERCPDTMPPFNVRKLHKFHVKLYFPKKYISTSKVIFFELCLKNK